MILILNAGSSTLKYKLFSVPDGTVQAHGSIESIGESNLSSHRTHQDALQTVFVNLAMVQDFNFAHLTAIGHRVVHGGNDMLPVELVDETTIDRIMPLLEQTTALAPLHNPPAIRCLEAARAISPSLPNVLVFDTGFFRELPDVSKYYALPAWCYQKYKIRRYGAHGTSHRYVSIEAAKWLEENRRPSSKIVTLHLGNGASAAAIEGGVPLDTSMGLTPLEGLVMGTRSGDLDPAIIPYLQSQAGLSAAEIDTMLNRESGLKGLCGDNDMRLVEGRASAGDRQAKLAIDLFVQRICKYLGAYAAVLRGLDAIVFTAGIGQHSSLIRSRVCEQLGWLGVAIDDEKNLAHSYAIDAADSRISILVIPTDEERSIYDQTLVAIAR